MSNITTKIREAYKSYYFDIILSAIIILIVTGLTIYQSFSQQQMIVLYILDNNKRAVNYPHTIVLGTNSTITFYIGIDNRLWYDTSVTLKVRLDSSIVKHPLYVYERKYFLKKDESTLEFFKINFNDTVLTSEKVWIRNIYINGKQFFANLNIEKGGILYITVELWQDNKFSGQWVELKIKIAAWVS